MRARWLLLAGIAVPVLAVALLLGRSALADEPAKDLLPDLAQAAPDKLSGRTGGTSGEPRFYLGFASAAGNLGDGPLIVDGTRPSTDQPEMPLVQHIRRSDGSTRTKPVGASLVYVDSPTHSHWHMLGFMRYELRTSSGERALLDHKTGFCLGDRYKTSLAVAAAEATPRYSDECGRGKRGLLRLREGISVGWGDDYDPHLEGQEFDVTALDAGRYVLVHRVNPERRLLESDYSDNVASMALELSWPRGRNLPPQIDVIARCPGTATCG